MVQLIHNIIWQCCIIVIKSSTTGTTNCTDTPNLRINTESLHIPWVCKKLITRSYHSIGSQYRCFIVTSQVTILYLAPRFYIQCGSWASGTTDKLVHKTQRNTGNLDIRQYGDPHVAMKCGFYFNGSAATMLLPKHINVYIYIYYFGEKCDSPTKVERSTTKH